MSIDLPGLDDVAYEDLIERARHRITANSDSWTDFNPHDPGVTMLELLAWLTETYSYQLDTITDEHREAYLRLLGERRRPPTPASTSLTLDPPADLTGVEIPAGEQLIVSDGTDEKKLFETTESVVLTAATVAAVVTTTGHTWTDQTTANDTEEMVYRAFGDDPTPGTALAVGFDGDPFAEMDRLSVWLDFHDDDLAAPGTHECAGVSFEPSVELVWEYCTDTETPDSDDSWKRLSVSSDGTNSLYEGGTVVLERPTAWETAVGDRDHGVYGCEPELYWLRCRVETGGYEIPPQLDAVAVNVVEASHQRTVESETLHRVSEQRSEPALDDQTYGVEHTPVLSATVRVDGDRWVEVPSFDASGPDDHHYVLDREAGTVRFGDGEDGRQLPVGASVVATYTAGGGVDGNVATSANWRFRDGDRSLSAAHDLSGVAVQAREPATGGTDTEGIETALTRARRQLDTPYRAVTTKDYATLARQTPGVRVARATVTIDGETDPEITVTVVPYAPPDVSPPVPSEGLLAAVQRHLDRHRLLADRVSVVEPTYVGLAIDLDVTTVETRGVGTRRDIETAIEEYLHPLVGFDGDGWPFGRSVSTDELATLVADLDGVDQVADIGIEVHGAGSVDSDGTVVIDADALFTVETVSIETTERPTGGESR